MHRNKGRPDREDCWYKSLVCKWKGSMVPAEVCAFSEKPIIKPNSVGQEDFFKVINLLFFHGM